MAGRAPVGCVVKQAQCRSGARVAVATGSVARAVSASRGEKPSGRGTLPVNGTGRDVDRRPRGAHRRPAIHMWLGHGQGLERSVRWDVLGDLLLSSQAEWNWLHVA